MGGEGAAEALISPASLLEALCGPGGIPLAVVLPLWNPAHAAIMPLRCDAGTGDDTRRGAPAQILRCVVYLRLKCWSSSQTAVPAYCGQCAACWKGLMCQVRCEETIK